jgi:predicted histone-like DNA-binding protein
MQDGLESGTIVRLGELGSLRISISSNGETNEEDVSVHSIKSSKCIFTPGKELKKMLKNLEYEKVN